MTVGFLFFERDQLNLLRLDIRDIVGSFQQKQSLTTTNSDKKDSTNDIDRPKENNNDDNVRDEDLKEQRRWYATQSKQRRAALTNPKSKLSFVYYAFVPTVQCPTAVRVGDVLDGGKWVCNPWRFNPGCVIVSFGVGGDVTFEREMETQLDHRCRILSFDSAAKYSSLFNGTKITFRAVSISPTHDPLNNKMSIDGIMRDFKLDRIDVLKVDIESAEFRILPPILSNRSMTDRICQIPVEIHDTKSRANYFQLLRAFESGGFHLMYSEPNHQSRISIEYVFVNQKCFQQLGIMPLDGPVFNNFS